MMKFHVTISAVDDEHSVIINPSIQGNSLIEVLSKLPLAVKELERDLENLLKEPEIDDDIPF